MTWPRPLAVLRAGALARGDLAADALLRLRALEEEGIVERQTYPEVPPRVEYALTEKGRALVPIVESMRVYGREWLNEDGGCVEKPTAAEPVAA